MDVEVDVNTIEGHKISAQKNYEIYACGKLDAAWGTDGTFDLIDTSNKALICTVEWSSPYGNYPNIFQATGSNAKWIVEVSPINQVAELGRVWIKLYKLP